MKKVFKYCGEIIDHSWFVDFSIIKRGTSYPTNVTISFYDSVSPETFEWYISLDNHRKIYLDEYPEQEKLREGFFNSVLLYKNRFGQKSYSLNGTDDCFDKEKLEELIAKSDIEEIIKCSLISEHSNPLGHFYRRFMRRN